MYRDKCIESCKKIANMGIFYRAFNPKIVIGSIKQAQSFYVGEWKEMEPLQEKSYGKPIDDLYDVFYHTPFRTTWVSFDYCGQEIPSSCEADLIVTKASAIISPAPGETHEINILIFFKLHPQYVDRNLPQWLPYPFLLKLLPNNRFKTANIFSQNSYESNILKTPQDINGEITTFYTVLKLLSCKNIVKNRHRPDSKLNKKRIKAGKEPLYTYHTLDLILPGRKRMTEPGDPTGRTVRLHLCRGHFKEYTQEKPLFGKHTGRYWWQPIARGEKTKGVVMKDYNVIYKNDHQ